MQRQGESIDRLISATECIVSNSSEMFGQLLLDFVLLYHVLNAEQLKQLETRIRHHADRLVKIATENSDVIYPPQTESGSGGGGGGGGEQQRGQPRPIVSETDEQSTNDP